MFGRRLFLSAVALAATGSVVAGCTKVNESPQPSRARSDRRAVPVGFAGGSALLWASDIELSRTLDAVVESGATLIRFDVSWTFAEPSRGHFDWRSSDRVVDAAMARQLQVLATITNTPAWAAIDGLRHTGRPADPDRYGEFARQVATHYRDRIHNYELWNEPNGRMFFQPDPDAATYAAMLRSAYPKIKEVDPDTVVVAGALGAAGHSEGVVAPLTFLRQMYENGVHGSFDALSYHPYDYQAPLAVGALYESAPMRQLLAMHELMERNGDGSKPIWITEYGAPSTKVDDAKQALLIVESARQWPEVSYAGPFIVHTVRDANSASTHDEDRFGLVTDTYVPKPAFTQLRSLLAEQNPPRDVYTDFSKNPDCELGGALTPVFELPGGRGQQFEGGYRFQAPTGYINSPTDVGNVALMLQVLPSGEFADGHQDFRAGQVRVFSSSRTGTHAVTGAILHAWEPSLGFPITGEYVPSNPVSPEHRAIDFEKGTISWSSTAGAHVVRR